MGIELALLSVSDKRGIEALATSLAGLGIQILSTGGTARALQKAGVPVTLISQHTGFPEILAGRVKTLHPRIHAGILARQDHEDDLQVLRDQEIPPIGLVVVNLYPFAETVAKPDIQPSEAIEQIDIGGPTLIRAAAKNHQHVTVLIDPSDYDGLIEELQTNSAQTGMKTRQRLATRAFQHTAAYDAAISEYFQNTAGEPEELPPVIHLKLECQTLLRYGENPHQRGALYASRLPTRGLVAAAQLQGKELSFNNYLDLEAAWQVCCDFEHPSMCAIIKHNNPCGAAMGETPLAAYEKALACDPVSAFGSVIGFNRSVDRDTATAMAALFVEAVIAPGYHEEAREIFARKKNLRVMEMAPTRNLPEPLDFKKVTGGFLVQDRDGHQEEFDSWKIVTRRVPDETILAELKFAWTICRHVKSNAVVIAYNGQTVGIGAGQMSRVDSVRLATEKAQQPVTGAVMASDAFFPFTDGVEAAAQAGIQAIIQPGGSVRDPEIVEMADGKDLVMVFTGRRHFRH